MKTQIRHYFLSFGSPDEYYEQVFPEQAESYWCGNPTVGQILAGVIVFPVFIVVYGLYRVLSLEVKI